MAWWSGDPAFGVVPGQVTATDLAGCVCPSGECGAVVGNVLVFWDYSDKTAARARTLPSMDEEALLEASGRPPSRSGNAGPRGIDAWVRGW
ncbi:hypothetical protein ADL05_00855 [Nocardiopsis sp. NRRL B-16309]|nr:hypothetical protein ADL05_00855 [Nocardiopsis sp. NRRL B-16309]